ncbi:MAG: hypothetical protein KF829_10655 [Ferruginibacter sp.]|nr:hypothetical protein [Ferruginibacter sp.]
MKRVFILFISILLIEGCSSSKKSYLERENTEKALRDAVKKLGKDSEHESAREAIPVLYQKIKQNHLNKISAYSASRELSRWPKIIFEYQALQQLYDLIMGETEAFKLVNPESYTVQLAETKEQAAQEYYDAGISHLNKDGRENMKKAYQFFGQSLSMVKDFKDAAQKRQEAYDRAIINVVVFKIEDRTRYYASGYHNFGNQYTNGYFEESLVRDLNNGRYPAHIYSTEDAYREGIAGDWNVKISLRNVNINYLNQQNRQRDVSASIETGRDTSGRPIYQTVYATLNITRNSFEALGEMQVLIEDQKSRRNIKQSSFTESYRWENETASYNGDSRALSAADWNIINNRGVQTPRREDILDELYRKLYPRVRNYVSSAINW